MILNKILILFNPIKYIKLRIIIIYIFVLALITILIIKNKFIRLLIIILISLVCFLGRYKLNQFNLKNDNAMVKSICEVENEIF